MNDPAQGLWRQRGAPLCPRDLVELWNGSPMGVLWQGRATVRRSLGLTVAAERTWEASVDLHLRAYHWRAAT